MGIKVKERIFVRLLCTIVVCLTLFFDYLYIDKLLQNWHLYSSIPQLMNLFLIGLVGYATLNILVTLGVKWSWI